MRRMAWQFSAFLFFTILQLGCATNEQTASNQNGQQSASDSMRYVTFRQGSEKGFRYTTISRSEIIFGDGDGSPMIINSKEDCELVKVENGLYTWKCVSNEDLEQMGTNRFLEGKGLDQNRIEFTTENSFGNFVSGEGGDPDSGTIYEDFPEKPVRVGDYWKGYTLKKGKRYVNSYTLQGIANVNGKEYAIVKCESEEKGGSSIAKGWVELTTGITYKSEANGTFVNTMGEKGSFRGTSYVVNTDGQPVLP